MDLLCSFKHYRRELRAVCELATSTCLNDSDVVNFVTDPGYSGCLLAQTGSETSWGLS